MSLEQNKEVARQYFEEIFNRHNFEIIEAIVAQDYVEHGAPAFQSTEPQEVDRSANGPEHMRGIAQWVLQAFPDVQFHLEHLIAEGDLVAVRSTWEGTQLGTFQSTPPTGKRFSTTRTDVLHIVDGKVVEHWANRDNLAQLLQLGILQAPQRPQE
jgi:predicted ester cyclase